MFRHFSARLIAGNVIRRSNYKYLNSTINEYKLSLHPTTAEVFFVRSKYITSGVQGRRNSKTSSKKVNTDDIPVNEIDDKEEDDILVKNSEYDALVSEALGRQSSIRSEENILVIQPYVKWGPKKSSVTPDLKLKEAEDLIRSLDTWNITESIIVPLVGFGKRTFFGSGKTNELKTLVKRYNGGLNSEITGIFVSVSQLTKMQKYHLEQEFGVPVMDRFSVVIQILSAHATSREAKLQIALAELPYVWHHLGSENNEFIRSKLTDSQKMMLRNRERHIKKELEHISEHRKMVRRKRTNKEFPIVAVVGYTNCGKTSLIKALTNQEKLQPQNKLFATLDVTAHMGRLPSNLQVLYIDTIGFMSDIPTGLMQCFITTLEDAMNADLIIHVQDVAHNNVEHQRQHVEWTLKNLMYNSESEKSQLLKNIINVGNKCDLVENIDQCINDFDDLSNENETSEPMHFISCTKSIGLLKLVEAIERNILKVTNRKKMIIRVPQGGEELAWLYKNTAVTNTQMCDRDSEYLKVHVLLTDLALTLFKNTFLKRFSK